MSPNPTLKGHKLMVVSPLPTPQEHLDRLRSDYPDLQVESHLKPFKASFHDDDDIPEEAWKDVTILLILTGLPEVAKVPKLEIVQLISAGANHVMETPLWKDTEVAFCTANGVHGPQISEWVISTFLAHQHSIPKYLEFQKEARWNRFDALPEDSYGKRVGILGYGAIGRQVARVCKAMGMDIHAYTLHPKETPEARRDDTYTPEGTGDVEGVLPSKWFSGASKEDLHQFIGSDLDLLVISLPLTPKTTGLFGKEEFEVMSKRKTYVSNISRGAVIKQDDLIEALNNETIRGAALDVTDPEPLPDGHPLWSAKNVIITPHVSGGSTTMAERIFGILGLNLKRLSEGKELVNKVNRKEGY